MRLGDTPVDNLRYLASHAASEALRVQASRALIEIGRQEREYRERREREERSREPEGERPASPLEAFVEETEALDDVEVARDVVDFRPRLLERVLVDDEEKYEQAVAPLREFIEQRARELSDRGAIEAEIERRAGALPRPWRLGCGARR